MVQQSLLSTSTANADHSLAVCDTHRKLYFTLELKDVQAKQGTSVKLTCSVTGFDPVFKWYKDARPLSWNTNCLNMTKGVIGTVRLARLTPQDAGEYKCIVQNAHGDIETKCHLEVLPNPDMPLVRPRFVNVTDYYVYQFDELVLACRVDSVAEPVVKFYKDGNHLHLNGGRYSQTVEENDTLHSLVISHPNHEDSGLYTIKVKNDAGEETQVHRIEFLGRESHKKMGEEKITMPTHRRRRKNSQEEQQRDYAFERLLEKREQYKKAKALGANLPQNETPEDEGEKEPEPEKLTRAQRREREKLEARNHLFFEATLKDVIQMEGTTVKFVCSVCGPDPTFKWFKNNEPINFTKTLKNDSKLNVGSITIQNVSSKDAGTYKCEVSNKMFTIESEAKLTVLQIEDPNCEPPTITRAIKEYYTSVTDDLVLEIRVRGNPRPKVQWIKDCLEVDNPEYFAPGKFLPIREANGVYKLAIHDPQRGDSGRYVFMASNPGGKVDIAHDVKVKPKTEYAHVHGITYADVKQKKIKENIAERRKSQLEQISSMVAKVQEKKEEIKEETGEDGETQEKRKPEIPEDPKFAIKLLSNLKNVCVLEGGQARLVFSIDGYRPECRWFKDDEPLEFSGNVKNISKDTIGGLTIQKVGVSDEGLYKCYISNRFCEISTQARVEVIRKPEEKGQPPMFTRKRHYYDVTVDQLIMEVQISGLPLTNMIWYKDCREVVNNEKYLLTREPNGIYKLCIDSPVRRDCGTYVVQVENAYGFEQLKHEIEFWDKNDFVHANRVEHADPKKKWKKMETVPVKRNELIYGDETAQETTKQESSSQKRYRPFEMPPEMSRAEKKKQQYKLEFITTLRNHTVVKGSNIKLSCCTSDAVKLKVSWTKDGEPIEKDIRIRENLTKEGFCTLELLKVTPDDSGVYECIAKTPQGEAKTRSTVKVYELEAPTAVDAPPVLVTGFVDYYRPAFNDIVIECKITGSPKPRIKWIRDGLTVEFADKYEYYYKDDGTCTLVVNRPRMIDSGKYILIAKNSAGELELTHEMVFEGYQELAKPKKIYTIEIENETKPRVYPRPKEPTPEPVVEAPVEAEEEVVVEEEEVVEEFVSDEEDD
ncbi:muscle M-line assembly protein unc-89-like [Culicoides brevitarsis]|uniref:muscle M-line assembly protein unc-89-like n=1 Tax=Culicoides brevitarsis TaxID=469753 RepID=UPI00307C67A8